MDFGEVCNYFGGSIFPEDFRRNLNELSYNLFRPQTHLGPQTINTWACDTLLRTIWHALSATPPEESTPLSQLISQPALSPRWLFRAHAYRILLLSWLLRPPYFRFCSLSGSPAKITDEEVMVTNHVVHTVGRDIEACNRLMQHATSLDTAEFFLFSGIHFLPDALQLVRGLHPRSGMRGVVLSDLDVELVRKTRHSFRSAQVILDASGLVSLSAYVDGLLHELGYAENLPNNFKYMQRMRAKYVAAGDLHGVGIHALRLGNLSCSTPFTSPIVLNLNIRDDWDDCGGDSSQYSPLSSAKEAFGSLEDGLIQDNNLSSLTNKLEKSSIYQKVGGIKFNATEGAGALLQRSTVQKTFHYYELARKYFQGSGSARGVAAATLHQACFLRLLTMPSDYTWTVEEHSQLSELLSRAELLFAACGDTWGLRLAQTHRISTHTRNADRLNMAREIGRWAEQLACHEFGLHLGLLVLRIAHHARYIRGSIHEARHHLHISLSIFDAGSRRSSALLQSLVLEIECLISLGDYRSALRWLDNMVGLSQNVVLAFAEHLQRYPEEMLDNISGFQKRVFAHQHYIKKACELAITVYLSVYPQNAENKDSMKNVIEKLMQDVAALDVFNTSHVPTAAWRANQEDRLRFARAVVALDIPGPLSDEQEAECALALEECLSLSEGSTLISRLLAVDLLVRLEERDEAAAVLSNVQHGLNTPTDVPEEILSDRYLNQKDIRSHELLLKACIQVRDWEAGRKAINQLEDMSPGYFTGVSSYTKTAPWERCLMAGLVMEGLAHHGLALRFLAQGSSLYTNSQYMRQVMSGTGDRLIQLQTGGGRLSNSFVRVLLWLRDNGSYAQELRPFSASNIMSKAFKVFINPGDYLSEDPEYEALGALERDKRGLLNELGSSPSAIDRAQLLRDQYQIQMIQDLISMSRPRTTEEELELARLEKNKEHAQSLLERASLERDWTHEFGPVEEDFWERVVSNGDLDSVLVILVSVDEDGMALLGITDQGINHASYDSTVDNRVVRGLVNTCLHEFTSSKGHKPWHQVFDCLALMSAAVLGPLKGLIDMVEHVVFASTGDLTRFPFNTLIHNDRHLGLQKAVSQAPSLFSLLYLMTRNRDKGQISNFCALAKPGSLREARRTGEREIPMAGIEAIVIGLLLGIKPRNAAHTTRDEFLSDFESCDWLHLGTHGSVDIDAPFHSFLSLKEKLRVMDLLAVQSTVRVVVFSACLSGLGKATDRGDILGFSHAVLAAGADAFIGALWHTNDLATLLHMYFFYWELLNHKDNESIATVWRRATSNLYYLNRDKFIRVFESFFNGWDAAEELGLQPGKFVKNGRRKLQDLKEEVISSPTEIDFKHPYFWAPFILMGNAEQYFRAEYAADPKVKESE